MTHPSYLPSACGISVPSNIQLVNRVSVILFSAGVVEITEPMTSKRRLCPPEPPPTRLGRAVAFGVWEGFPLALQCHRSSAYDVVYGSEPPKRGKLWAIFFAGLMLGPLVALAGFLTDKTGSGGGSSALVGLLAGGILGGLTSATALARLTSRKRDWALAAIGLTFLTTMADMLLSVGLGVLSGFLHLS